MYQIFTQAFLRSNVIISIKNSATGVALSVFLLLVIFLLRAILLLLNHLHILQYRSFRAHRVYVRLLEQLLVQCAVIVWLSMNKIFRLIIVVSSSFQGGVDECAGLDGPQLDARMLLVHGCDVAWWLIVSLLVVHVHGGEVCVQPLLVHERIRSELSHAAFDFICL